MYSLRLKKSSFRIGVRVEYTDVNGDFISSNTKVKQNYANLLPNIQFTNRVSQSQRWYLDIQKDCSGLISGI